MPGMNNPQDVGGVLANDPYPSTAVSAPDEVDTPLSVALGESEKAKQFWEYQTHAVYTLLLDKGLITAAGVRRAIESLPRAAFKRCGLEHSCISTSFRGILTHDRMRDERSILTLPSRPMLQAF